MADNQPADSVLAAVGHIDGEDLGNGEQVVFDYDKDGQFIGWHKAPINN